jgi:hypothetical protein
LPTRVTAPVLTVSAVVKVAFVTCPAVRLEAVPVRLVPAPENTEAESVPVEVTKLRPESVASA